MSARRWLIAGAATCLLYLVALVGSTILVQRATRGRTYSDVAAVPFRRVGLVLGTSRLLGDGRPNGFFDNRIAAAAALIRARKVDYLIVSGDNHIQGYDEPGDMKAALIQAGVPPERIYCDYAGFRTLDSIVRVREVFRQNQVTIVSQEFHNQRAIYIALHHDIDAIGFNARDIDAYYSFKTRVREVFARANMMIDLYVRRRSPKYLGKPVVI